MRRKKYILIGLIVIFVLFLPAHFAFAADGSWWAGALSWVTLAAVSVLGKLLTLVMGLVDSLFQWEDFNNAGVNEGWVIVRDLCNMFFILILLVIAFGTILRIESYNVKRLLPKLLIVAVLINFSKMICLLLIDFSQIIMLSFASVFAGNSSNIVTALGLQHLQNIVSQADFSEVPWQTFFISVLSLVFVVIAFIVMVIIMGILLMRMVMFWILLILSPLAFLAAILPTTSRYFSQWWSEFTRYLVVGPALAFFVYLSLLMVDGVSGQFAQITVVNGEIVGGSGMGQWENVSRFVIAIGLLLGAIKITKSSGAAGASAGLALASGIRNRGMNLSRRAGKRVAGNVAKAGGRLGVGLVGAGLRKVGREGATGIRGDIHKAGKFMGDWRADMKKKRKDEKAARRLRTLQRIGIGEKGYESLQKAAKSRLGRGIKHLAVGSIFGGMATGGLGWAAAGGIMGGRLFAGHLKRKAETRKAAREEKKENLAREKEKKIAEIKERRDMDLRAAELRFKFNPKERMARVEEIKKEKKEKLSQELKKAIEKLQSQFRRGDIKKQTELNRKVEETKRQCAVKTKEIDGKYDAVKDRIKGVKLGEKEYNEEVKKINDKYQPRINSVNDNYRRRINETDKSQRWIDKQMEKYEPNRVTIEAAKKGASESEIAENRMKALSKGEMVHKFSDSSFYSPSGQSSTQYKLIDKLTSRDRASVKALNNMVATLERIASGEIALTKSQRENIKGLKKGLAAFKKAGGNTANLRAENGKNLIEVVNKIDTGGEDGTDTVEDFEERVIEYKK